jgi:mRNA interferase MazF
VADAPRIGDVLLARLPIHVPPGHEQEGVRPVVVVGELGRVATPRFGMVFVAPVTSRLGTWTGSALYPVLQQGTEGLARDSAVMLDHARGVDATRVLRRSGRLSKEDYAPIQTALKVMLALQGQNESRATGA